MLGGFAFTRLLTIDSDSRRIVGDALPGVTAILQLSVNTRENRALMLEHILAQTPAEKSAIEASPCRRRTGPQLQGRPTRNAFRSATRARSGASSSLPARAASP